MSIFFQNREGHTPLDPSMNEYLIPKHLTHMTELYEYEIENIAMGISWSKQTKKDHRDYMTWLELHKHMLDDVWTFAGKVRKKELNNPDFLMPYEVRPELKVLQDNFTFWLENKTFVEEELIARLHERLLTIHPFTDGNGRWSRLLVNMICDKENLKIPSWGKAIEDDRERRKAYLDSVKKARKEENYQELIGFMYSTNN